jgi:hypothetical protein
MYEPGMLYSFIIQPNKRKIYVYIYKRYLIYRKHSSMFRYTRIIYSQCYPSTLSKLQKSLGLQTQ